MALGGFQPSAFQSPGFQQASYSGGSGFDAAFADVYAKFRRRNEEQLENIPKKVVDAIKEVAQTDNKKEREEELRKEIKSLELRYRRNWALLADKLHNDLIDQQIKKAFADKAADLKRRNNRALILLLM